MIVQNRVAKKWKSKILYRTKAVSKPPLAVLHVNNNGVIVFHMERGVGWSVSLTRNAYYWWSYDEQGEESMNRIPPLKNMLHFSGLKVRGKNVGATMITLETPPENTPNMASTANDSNLSSLSSPVLPYGNDGQRYRDGLPQLFSGQSWPLAAAAIGKHRQNASSMHRAFT